MKSYNFVKRKLPRRFNLNLVFKSAYILTLISEIIFFNKSKNMAHLMYLSYLSDFKRAGKNSWGASYLAWLDRQLYKGAVINNKDLACTLSKCLELILESSKSLENTF